MVLLIANDGVRPCTRVLEFDTLDEASDWIDEQLMPVEGVGTRTRKMYRIFVGEFIELTKGKE